MKYSHGVGSPTEIASTDGYRIIHGFKGRQQRKDNNMSTMSVATNADHRHPKFEKIVTCSDLMLPVFDQASRAAKVDATVLITGESGVGKELVAEAIHANSPRRNGPFVIVNMAAVPESLIESELFGHVAGAFTGSTGTRVGRFEAAHGGTLFIDEIGDLALECQAKLLRVLENHCVTPVGSNENKSPDVRVIAATNRRLEDMVRQGKFREELYYRLNVVSIALPPLRERPEDVEPLINLFLKELSDAYQRPVPTLDRDLISFLQSYPWPGNIRQLRNCVESMFVLADSPTLTMDDVPEMMAMEPRETVRIDIPERLTLEEVEKAVVFQTLDRCQGNRTRAARSLGISVRTLQRRLKRWENIEQ
ncbi:MAG: sigma-54 interaction domain-containing protein [Planctomycetota bacterium]